LTFADEAKTANALVPKLKAEGADTIVLLIHQGGRVPPVYDALGCDGLSGEIVPILGRLDPAIRVVVSGHTHHAYACEVEAGGAPRLLTSGRQEWISGERHPAVVRSRNTPAGRNQGGECAGAGGGRPAGPALVDRYVAAARPAAERVVGRLSRPALKDPDDGDSSAGELIADAQSPRRARRAGAGRRSP
jgi:5'-nucleotidase